MLTPSTRTRPSAPVKRQRRSNRAPRGASPTHVRASSAILADVSPEVRLGPVLQRQDGLVTLAQAVYLGVSVRTNPAISPAGP